MTQTHDQPSPRRARAPRRARGPLLAGWIILVGVFGAVTAAQAVLVQPSALGLATSAFVLLCAWGLWAWQRWAYYSLMVAIAIAGAAVFLGVLSGATDVIPLVVVIAAAAITVALIQPRLGEFR